MIILEGPDGGGKSTLAEWIAAVQGSKVYRSPGPCSSAAWKERMYWHKYITALDRGVMDRCMLSEYVYGNVLRCRSHVKIEEVNEFLLNFLLTSKSNIFVYCGMKFPAIKKTEGSIHLDAAAKKLLEDAAEDRKSDIDKSYTDFLNQFISNVMTSESGLGTSIGALNAQFITIRTIADYQKLFNKLGEIK